MYEYVSIKVDKQKYFAEKFSAITDESHETEFSGTITAKKYQSTWVFRRKNGFEFCPCVYISVNSDWRCRSNV